MVTEVSIHGVMKMNNQFYKSDLDLDSMTLVLKHDLDMVNHTKNEVSMSMHSKFIAKTDRQTV